MLLLFGAFPVMFLAWKWEFSAALISLFALGEFAAVVHLNSYGVLANLGFQRFCPSLIGIYVVLYSTPITKPALISHCSFDLAWARVACVGALR